MLRYHSRREMNLVLVASEKESLKLYRVCIKCHYVSSESLPEATKQMHIRLEANNGAAAGSFSQKRLS